MPTEYAVAPVFPDGQSDADALRSRSRARAEREARRVVRTRECGAVAALVIRQVSDSEGCMMHRETIAAVGDAAALDAAGCAGVPVLYASKREAEEAARPYAARAYSERVREAAGE